MQAYSYCRDEMKKKGMQFTSLIAPRWTNLTHSAALTFPGELRLEKYSSVTCRSEQSHSKFDTYSYELKSTFGTEADLNTLTARQVKSTFGG